MICSPLTPPSSRSALYATDCSTYKTALKEQAGAYGFTPEQVDAMDKPVLVRQVEHPATIEEARRLGTFTYRMLMAAIIPAVLGAYVSVHGPNDDENAAEWAAKRALLFPPETVPLLGNMTRAIEEGNDAKFSPFVGVIDKAVTAGVQAGSDKEDKDWTGIGLNAGEAAGRVAGVPGTIQAARVLRYVHRENIGMISDPNAWDAVVGAPHK